MVVDWDLGPPITQGARPSQSGILEAFISAWYAFASIGSVSLTVSDQCGQSDRTIGREVFELASFECFVCSAQLQTDGLCGDGPDTVGRQGSVEQALASGRPPRPCRIGHSSSRLRGSLADELQRHGTVRGRVATVEHEVVMVGHPRSPTWSTLLSRSSVCGRAPGGPGLLKGRSRHEARQSDDSAELKPGELGDLPGRCGGGIYLGPMVGMVGAALSEPPVFRTRPRSREKRTGGKNLRCIS